MFGYVRPLRGELKVREYESFKAVYCGLCHRMGHRCGFASRFLVNYDLAFMAMLLTDADAAPCYEHHRCIASPFRKKCCHSATPALDSAADYSVILSWWKLRDSVQDDGFWKAAGARLAMLFLRRSYRRAAKAAPEFDRAVSENLTALNQLESEHCPSLDRPADKFACILTAAAASVQPEMRHRALAQVFYHTGRIVYLLDAADDLAEDVRHNRYNPLLYRFGPSQGTLSSEQMEALRLTLRHSENMLISAYQLLDPGPWSEILTNIIYLGIPAVINAVLSGNWHKPRRNET
jgi:hypothetical protein